jgi:hypothetical protein
MQFAVSRQEQISCLEFPKSGLDSNVEIIFNKILELNAIYGKNINFFYAPYKKLFMIQH